MNFYPLKFKPIFKERIWGGQKLRDLFDKEIPELQKIGESWELADLPQDKSEIINGEFADKTINWIINKYPKEIMGKENFSGPFPLLIKILDAEDILSVQVHPDQQTCLRMGKGEPKTECWYIISAQHDSVIYKGLKEGVTKEQFADAIEKGNVAELLKKISVNPGQCHFLPAGTAHSIGAGLLIAEIQTPSDTTYRVFDFNRVDKNGKSRQLHIEQALESIHFGSSEDKLTVRSEGLLVDCEYFKINKESQTKGSQIDFAPGKMKTLIILKGHGKLIGSDGFDVEFNPGDTVLVPALYEGKMHFDEDVQYLTITI